MNQNGAVWILSVNEQRGILWRGSLTSHESEHYEQIDTLDNEWEAHQHHRPSPLRSKDNHSHAAPPKEDATLRRHFAKDVAEWVEKKMHAHDVPALELFAPPRFLGELRKVMPDGLRSNLREHEGDLVYMGPSELQKHPGVSKLVRRHSRSS